MPLLLPIHHRRCQRDGPPLVLHLSSFHPQHHGKRGRNGGQSGPFRPDGAVPGGAVDGAGTSLRQGFHPSFSTLGGVRIPLRLSLRDDPTENIRTPQPEEGRTGIVFPGTAQQGRSVEGGLRRVGAADRKTDPRTHKVQRGPTGGNPRAKAVGSASAETGGGVEPRPENGGHRDPGRRRRPRLEQPVVRLHDLPGTAFDQPSRGQRTARSSADHPEHGE